MTAFYNAVICINKRNIKMKKNYLEPSLNVVTISVEDVICVSKVDSNLDIITSEPNETL